MGWLHRGPLTGRGVDHPSSTHINKETGERDLGSFLVSVSRQPNIRVCASPLNIKERVVCLDKAARTVSMEPRKRSSEV
jgi:hypothetical protein